MFNIIDKIRQHVYCITVNLNAVQEFELPKYCAAV